MNKEKLISLQVLRAFAFLGIFTSHSRLNSQFGAWGVSIFFILSGFLMIYNYIDRSISFSLKEGLFFSINKINKLYYLHLIMTFVAIPYQIYITEDIKNIKTIISLISKFVLNVTLLQTWSPYMTYYASYNGVSWFLSVCLFLYFIFPLCFRFIKRFNNKRNLLILMSIVYIIQITFAYITRNIIFDAGEVWGNYYFAYTFPLFRLGDFFIGCCLGYLFCITEKHKIKYASFHEIVILFLIVVSALFYSHGYKWFRLNLLWTLTSVPLIYIMANDGGIITKIFSRKLVIFFGDISIYTFLIHEMVIIYCSLIINHFIKNYCEITSYLYLFALSIVNLLITIILACLWKKSLLTINNKRIKKMQLAFDTQSKYK